MSQGRVPLTRSNITACFRCRQKKKRCDQKLPQCSLCEVAGVDCVGYDAVAKRPVARSYILELEDRIAYLETKLGRLETREPGSDAANETSNTIELRSTTEVSQPRIPEDFGSTSMQDAANYRTSRESRARIDQVSDTLHQNTNEEPIFSDILLRESLKPKIGLRRTNIRPPWQTLLGDQVSIHFVNDLDNSPATLPPEGAAQTLIKAYFQFARGGMALLHELVFQEKVTEVYAVPKGLDYLKTDDSKLILSHFFVFEVLAIALMILHKEQLSRMSTSLADRYHEAALKAVRKVGLTSDVEGVQALLLIGQFSYHHPTVWASWKTIGAALRLSVELGLHQDSSSHGCNALDQDTMRRTFWVAYAMDRNVAMAMGLPSCLSDGAITTEFPSQVDDKFITPTGIATPSGISFWSKSIGLHLFRYRQIQSEMKTTLYEKPPAHISVNFEQWQQDMHNRIQGWYDSIPSSSNLTSHERKDVENYELTYYHALLYLYYPSINIPHVCDSGLVTLARVASKTIKLYHQFFDERRLTIYWQAVENLFSAGNAILLSYAQSATVRENLGLRSLESLVRTCSSVLWGMVEHFPDFRAKRDAFDITASRMITTLTLAPAAAASTSSSTLVNDQADESMDSILVSTTILQTGQQNLPEFRWPAEAHSGAINSSNQEQLPNPNLSIAHSTATEGLDMYSHPTQSFSPNFDEILFDLEDLDSSNEFFNPAWL